MTNLIVRILFFYLQNYFASLRVCSTLDSWIEVLYSYLIVEHFPSNKTLIRVWPRFSRLNTTSVRNLKNDKNSQIEFDMYIVQCQIKYGVVFSQGQRTKTFNVLIFLLKYSLTIEFFRKNFQPIVDCSVSNNSFSFKEKGTNIMQFSKVKEF